MKKYLVLLMFAGLALTSACSSDDDGDNVERSIVATWTLTSVNPPFFDLEECPSKPTITFGEDSTTIWTFYNSDQNCQPETDEGTWQKNSATNYTVTIPGYGSFDGTVEFQSENKFTFTSSYQGFPISLTFEK